jgi:hypothetical protein
MSSRWEPEQPDNDAKLWRYMSFGKYVDMLTTSSLYFARADHLGDDFEGARGKATGMESHHPPLSVYGKTAPRERFSINSWHIQEFEQASMWPTYGRSTEAVAVRSSFLKLRSQLPKRIIIGKVKYQRYKAEHPELSNDELRRYFTKRRAFETDRELRAIINEDLGRETFGVHRKVNLSKLIFRVYVGPDSKAWFRETVEAITRQFDLTFDVLSSPMTSTATY